MYKRTRRTVRIDLTDNEDLARYDEILNDPLCTVTREIKEHRTTTTFVGTGEDAERTTEKVPILIITYETRELL